MIDALARQYEMSPIPIREAIRRLEAEELVTYTAHVGAEVRGLDRHAYNEVVTTLARLEGFATALAHPYVVARDLDQLKRLAGEMDQALQGADIPRYIDLSGEFHDLVRLRCPNQYLVNLIQGSLLRIDLRARAIVAMQPERARASLHDHYQLIQSLAEKAPPRVMESLVERHCLQTLEALPVSREMALRDQEVVPSELH